MRTTTTSTFLIAMTISTGLAATPALARAQSAPPRPSVFQTTLEGESRLFSVGRYAVEVGFVEERPLLKRVTVIADTGLVPTLLATPI